MYFWDILYYAHANCIEVKHEDSESSAYVLVTHMKQIYFSQSNLL